MTFSRYRIFENDGDNFLDLCENVRDKFQTVVLFIFVENNQKQGNCSLYTLDQKIRV